jgi:hypothetical protein
MDRTAQNWTAQAAQAAAALERAARRNDRTAQRVTDLENKAQAGSARYSTARADRDALEAAYDALMLDYGRKLMAGGTFTTVDPTNHGGALHRLKVQAQDRTVAACADYNATCAALDMAALDWAQAAAAFVKAAARMVSLTGGGARSTAALESATAQAAQAAARVSQYTRDMD